MYGGDNAIFIMMGKMFLKGMVPYVDFFDHKGPTLIFIEALGVSLSPDNARMGIFFLQIINLTLIQILIYHTARHFVSAVNSFSAVLVSLLIFSFTIQGGNSTEEYSILFTLLSLLLTVRFCTSGNNKIKPLHIIIIGASAAALFWLRLNNMGQICAYAVFMFIVLCRNKDWQGIQKLILSFTIGFLLVSLPIIIYYQMRDALPDMIYATFLFNLKYVKTESLQELDSVTSIILHIIKAWTSLGVLLIGGLVYFLKNRNFNIALLSVLMFAFGWFSTHLGPGLYHYMTLNIPCLVLGLALLLDVVTAHSSKRKLVWLCCIASAISLSGYMVGKYNYQYYWDEMDDSDFITQSETIADEIPADERDSVYGYNVFARFWTYTDLYPSYKYFILQEWQGLHDPQIIDDINFMLDNHSPKWVVSQFRETSDNIYFYEIIDEKYSLHKSTNDLELYRLNEK